MNLCFFSFNLKTYFIWKYFALFVIIIIIILYVIFHSFHYHLFTWTKRNPVSIEFYIWSLEFLVYSHYLFTSIRNFCFIESLDFWVHLLFTERWNYKDKVTLPVLTFWCIVVIYGKLYTKIELVSSNLII